MDFEEAKLHAGGMIWEHGSYSLDIWRRAMRVIPHYIWTIGDEKKRRGYCTACERWVDLEPGSLMPNWAANDPYLDTDADGYPFIPFQIMPEHEFQTRHSGRTRHLDTGYCPECGERVQFRGMYRGHKSLTDRRFLIVYSKDALDPENAVVCVGYELYVPWRDMDDNEPGVPLEITPRELCVFRHGKGGQRFVHGWEWRCGGWQERWKHRRECKSGFAPGAGTFNGGIQTVLDQESFLEAVQGTPFAPVVMGDVGNISVSNAWDYYDRITIMDRLARYPCTEYLYRLGFVELAVAVIDKNTEGLLNLRGKTAQKVLRLTPDQWAEVKGKKLTITKETLWVCRLAAQKKLRMNMELCAWIGARHNGFDDFKNLGTSFPELDAVRAAKYCRKSNVQLNDYLDYMAELRELRMDMRDKRYLQPRDFATAHADLSMRVSHVRYHNKDTAIRKRLQSKAMDEYTFSALGLVLRPMVSGGEIVAEGTAQHHCVGRYVDTYAEGNNVLCVLREENNLRKPLYTVEFGRDGRLAQCRGYRNDMTDEGRERKKDDAERLNLFWKLFELMRADLRAQTEKEKKKRKRKEKAA